MNTEKIIVMGVSGSGKSLVGARLARTLALPFFDADDFHSPANIEKMSNGVPLSDTDRADWLDDLAELIQAHPGLVLACSALKKGYRDRLRLASQNLMFLYLEGDIDMVWSRHSQREDHYFTGKSMLESQFAQLEAPTEFEAMAIDISQSVEVVLKDCLHAIKTR
ncbi:gluconokinase [Saccharospirillum impatiens]|uniref:gluconokinase n=1 Tax=Saccharospirillum impatiens TaxID=169438 RepID=UPI00048F37AF|nr:gluconokinase [Saccharospirillum impatiens]